MKDYSDYKCEVCGRVGKRGFTRSVGGRLWICTNKNACRLRRKKKKLEEDPKQLPPVLQDVVVKVHAMFKHAQQLAAQYPESFDLELLFDMAKYVRARNEKA